MKKSVLTALALLPLAAAAQQTVYTPELLWKLGRLGEMQVSPDRKTVAYTVTRYSLADNKGQADIWTVPVAGGPARQLTTTPGASENSLNWRPDGRLTYLSSEGGSEQLYIVNADGTGKQQLSEFKDESLTNLKLAPKANFVLYTQDVKTGPTVQELFPDLPKADARIIDDLNYRHWNVWDDYRASHVFFQPLGPDGRPTGYGKDVMAGEKFDSPLPPLGGAEQLAFAPDGYRLAYTSRKLTGRAEAESTNSDIYLYDVRTGQTQNLSEGLPGYDTEPVFSPDGTRVAWLSMATPGFEADRNGVVVYDFRTKQRQDVMAGSEQSAGNVRWSPDGKTLYFVSVLEGTEQLFSVPSRGGKVKQLTQGAHNYNAFELASAGVAIVNKTTQAQPADLVRVDLKTGRETPLTQINQQELAGVKTSRTEARWVPTTDGKRMQVYVIYPPDFDSAKKYPTLLYCQGGPQSPITQSFSYRWNFQLLAAQGYIVVAPNRRGLPGFGTEWNNSISGDWGGQPIRDYLSAIDAVSQEPYVDKDRRGCVGASYGGYSVYLLAGKHEGRFKTFIAHCGLYNLTSWYPTTEEMFFANYDLKGAPWDATLSKAYTDFNPQQFARHWDTPLLVIHGGRDFRVPEDQGMEAFGTAQLRGIPSRFLYFPNEGHWISKPQNAVLWNRVFFEWLGRTLRPEAAK
ncbi:S9 family peptidase [Hymenobacter weizhouensis]|uniref:S9 family peptidase n=1 Tax=Hymenobacter sp. YIM 151500-1 TaxID=2987689 RepID=UPI002227DE6F|nr:S9 family peptidase [Hymenobacter sp. YIM 151500-1]UYZ62971.1 S9 family peptidase [Hymenobacter sp. YIM 151500-1]